MDMHTYLKSYGTLAEAKRIYRAKYWDAQRCDELPAGAGAIRIPDGRVFISYAHESPNHAKRVLKLSNDLREWGVVALIDQYLGEMGEDLMVYRNDKINPAKIARLKPGLLVGKTVALDDASDVLGSMAAVITTDGVVLGTEAFSTTRAISSPTTPFHCWSALMPAVWCWGMRPSFWPSRSGSHGRLALCHTPLSADKSGVCLFQQKGIRTCGKILP